MFVSKYSPSGAHVHSRAADAAGNAVFAGYSSTALDFGAGPTPGLGSLTLLELGP